MLSLALLSVAALSVAGGATAAPEPLAAGVERNSGADPNEDRAPEYRIKAAFLFQFIHFTTWPETAFENERQPLELVLVGKDPFGKLLDKTFAGKQLHGRSVKITRLSKVPATARGHMIFANGLSRADEDRLIKLCKGKPVLLFSDRADFATRGGCGNFFLERKKVRFAINAVATKATGLSMSSELLKLARIVENTEGKR